MWGFPFGRAPKNFINCNASRSVNIALAATSYQGGAVWWILQCSWMWGDGKEDKESCKCWRWHRERSKKTSRHFLDSDFYLWCDQFLEIKWFSCETRHFCHSLMVLWYWFSSHRAERASLAARVFFSCRACVFLDVLIQILGCNNVISVVLQADVAGSVLSSSCRGKRHSCLEFALYMIQKTWKHALLSWHPINPKSF